MSGMTKYYVRDTYWVDEAHLEEGNPFHRIAMVKAADVEQFVETLAKGMYLRHRPECIGDRILTDCTCGLSKTLAHLHGEGE